MSLESLAKIGELGPLVVALLVALAAIAVLALFLWMIVKPAVSALNRLADTVSGLTRVGQTVEGENRLERGRSEQRHTELITVLEQHHSENLQRHGETHKAIAGVADFLSDGGHTPAHERA